MSANRRAPVILGTGGPFRVCWSERLHHLTRMFHLRRLRQAMADELAPFLEIAGAAEIDRVVLQRLPSYEQAVAARVFDRAVKLHAAAALGAAKDRRRGLHAGLELFLRS